MRTFMSNFTDLDDLGASVVQRRLTRFKEVPCGVELMSRALVSDVSFNGQNQ